MSLQPQTEKLHQIIVGTAKFVKEHGGQSEVLLKVKQGNNPMFAFLNIDHHLHEYYKYLVQHPELLQSASQSTTKPAEASQTTGEGLSLLGFAYGSGDEDDERALKSEHNPVDVGAGGLGKAEQGQEGLSTSNGSKVKLDNRGGGSIVQGKAVAAPSRSVKIGDDSRIRVTESTIKALPQPIKKKKMLSGAGEVIQPNKRIVPQAVINDIPAKAPANASDQSHKKVESKTSSWHSVPSVKDMNYGMSADAAAAVVLAATRGARGLKQDSSTNKSSSSSGLSQKLQEASRQPTDTNGGKGITSLGLGPSDVKLAKAVAELAAIAASHEADSADTLLTPAEKLKAERLRKAKMFAAMIKSGKCGSESAEKTVEQPPGTSAATSARSEEMHVDALCVNGKAIANGKGVSIENSSLAEEVEESDIHRNVRAGSIDFANRHSVKQRKYRSKEQDPRSDSEESERKRKRKARHDHKGDKKHKHSKQRKHKHYDSESADSGLSSGDDIADEHKSKSLHRHHHHKRKRHHERDSKDGKHGQSRHKLPDDDDGDLGSSQKKHRHRRNYDRSSSVSEDETPQRGRAIPEDKQFRAGSLEKEQLLPSSPPHSKLGSVADDRSKSATTTEVPADIREKVRAMLLATL